LLRRAQAIAPQEPWTRGLALEKQLRGDNHEQAVVLAEGIIRDDVENRGGAFNLAIIGYVGSMIELGRAAAVIDFFESLKPGISTAGYMPTGIKEAFMQFMLVQALVNVGSLDTANAILDSLIRFADKVLPGWRDNAYVMATVSMMQGDRDSAIEYALQDLERPLGKNLDWSLNYEHLVWMKPLIRDERLAKRLNELRDATRLAGDAVRRMLARQASGQS